MVDLKEIIKDLEKKKIDVHLLSDEASPCVVTEWISTGCLVLDKIMGNGLPVGRMTEIYGDQSTGKSLIAAQVATVAQQEGHIVAYADTETAVSMDIMKAVGVDPDKLIYAAPDTVEEVFEFFETCIESKRLHYPKELMVIIWDSIAGTSIELEMESEYGKSMYGSHARLISQAMRKITRQFSKDRICALFLNQTREKIGVMFGDKTATFGGKAIGFHASVRVQLKMSGKLKIARKVIGVETKAIVVKNKVAVPYQEAILPIYFGHGIDDAWATLNYLEYNEVISKAGQYYTATIKGEELKFKKNEWPALFEDNYDIISNMVFEEGGSELDGDIEVDDTVD